MLYRTVLPPSCQRGRIEVRVTDDERLLSDYPAVLSTNGISDPLDSQRLWVWLRFDIASIKDGGHFRFSCRLIWLRIKLLFHVGVHWAIFLKFFGVQFTPDFALVVIVPVAPPMRSCRSLDCYRSEIVICATGALCFARLLWVGRKQAVTLDND
jgi:hypothetical protein